MSALALVPQDTAGLSAFIARKTPRGVAQDDDPDADFNAALAQTADALPASKNAVADTPPRIKGDDDIWRTLAALSDEAKPPPGSRRRPSFERAGLDRASPDRPSLQRANLKRARRFAGRRDRGRFSAARAATRSRRRRRISTAETPALRPSPICRPSPMQRRSLRLQPSMARGSDAAPARPSRAASILATSSFSSASCCAREFFPRAG